MDKRDPIWYLAIALLLLINAKVTDTDTLLSSLAVLTSLVASLALFVTWLVLLWRRP